MRFSRYPRSTGAQWVALRISRACCRFTRCAPRSSRVDEFLPPKPGGSGRSRRWYHSSGLLDEASAYAAIIALKSRTALRLAKEALNSIEPVDVDRLYRFEQGFTLEMYLHEDSQKARDAFVEKKGAADFRGD